MKKKRFSVEQIVAVLNRESWDVGKHLVYRLYKEEGLALKKRPQPKRKAVRHREERFTATAPNQARSIDFVADQLQDGTHFRALTIFDVYTREGVHRYGMLKSTPACRFVSSVAWRSIALSGISRLRPAAAPSST